MVEVESRVKRGADSYSRRRAVISVLGGHRITYLMSGAATAVVYYCLLGLGLAVAGDSIPYLFLVVVCNFMTVVIVYPWYRLVVFRSSGESWIRGYLRFYLVCLSFLGASLAGLPLLVELVGIPVMVAQGLIIIASPPLTYAIHRTWTFRDRGKR